MDNSLVFIQLVLAQVGTYLLIKEQKLPGYKLNCLLVIRLEIAERHGADDMIGLEFRPVAALDADFD